MSRSKCNFTIIELLVSVAIIAILFSMLMPAFNESREKARFARWLQFNKQCSNDPKCVINLNFQDDANNTLKNSALGYEEEGFSANDYNGVIKNNYELVQGRWKKGKKAILFDGMSTYIEFPKSKYVDFDGTKDFTIIAWVKFNLPADGSSNGIFNQTYLNGNYTGYCLYFVKKAPKLNKKRKLATADTGTANIQFNNMDKDKKKYATIDSEGWYQIVMRNKNVNDVQNLHIFLNGVQLNIRKSKTVAKRKNKCTALLSIGCLLNKKQKRKNYFKGKMDEFMVYSRALSNKEIKGHYEMGNVHGN